MTTLKLNPSLPFLFDQIFKQENDVVSKSNFNSLPSVNVLEKDDSYELDLAAPGLKKENFKINLQENKITISADKMANNEDHGGKFTRKEFSYEVFQRSFTLPLSINTEKIEANYVDGILKIKLPKKEEAKPKEPRAIEII